MTVKNHRTLRQIFVAPIAVGVLSTIGLVAALIGDGWWDAVSWLLLAFPVVLYFFYARRRDAVTSRSAAWWAKRG